MTPSQHAFTVTLAPDSFKGSLPAADVVAAMTAGVREVLGDAVRVVPLPMADGGEGTMDALLGSWQGREQHIETVDALGRPITARYGLSRDGKTAIIEAAEANGLPHVSDLAPQPQRAHSRGAGLLAKAALDQGVEQILLCVGGSASTDGGTGFLLGLGARFVDEHGEPVPPGGEGLARIARVDLSQLHSRARSIAWRIAVDVDNPLSGPRGAAAVFGPQKGARPDDVEALDRGLRHFQRMLQADHPAGAALDPPGLGAAGGLPLAPFHLLGAALVPGSVLVADALGLRERLAEADLVITGEGSFDDQSLHGKVVDLVRSTTPEGVPILVIAGRIALTADEIRASGLTAAFSLAAGPATLDALVDSAAERIREVTANAVAAVTALRQTPALSAVAQ